MFQHFENKLFLKPKYFANFFCSTKNVKRRTFFNCRCQLFIKVDVFAPEILFRKIFLIFFEKTGRKLQNPFLHTDQQFNPAYILNPQRALHMHDLFIGCSFGVPSVWLDHKLAELCVRLPFRKVLAMP